VLDTAAALFWEKGYDATTTREIAAAVGIQQASLYYHVSSKEGLLYQLCVSSLEQLLADVQSAVNEHTDPLDRLRGFIRAHLKTLLKHQVRHVTMLTELRALSKTHSAEVLALRKQYANLVRTELHDAQSAGTIRTDIPAKYLYLALLNVLNWAVIWFSRDQALTADELADLFTPIYLEGAIADSARVTLKLPNLDNHPRKAPKAHNLGKSVRKSTSQRLLRPPRCLQEKDTGPPARERSRRFWVFRKPLCTITSGAKKIFCTLSASRRWSRSATTSKPRWRTSGIHWIGSAR
jgi:AcrR family transcriptional regulator